MKILTTLLIALFLLVVPHMSYGSGQLKYRIQCGLSSDTDLHQKLNAIPDLKTFTLPSGSKIYFSGGYFNKYTQAKKRLEEVRGAGFSDAFIRVFKYSNLLSRSVGDSYIEKVKIKIQVSLMRDTISTNSTAVKVNTSPKKIYSRAEIERIKEKAALRKAKEKRENGSSEPKIKERKIKVDEEEKENIVKEPPVFKIFLGKSNNGEEGKEFKQLKNEIIYTYRERKETLYAVGFYKSEKEAQKHLLKYKGVVKEAKIVGLYKGKIISLKLANELLQQYQRNNITKANS